MQVEAFRVKKQTSMGEFKQMLAEKWNVSVERQRLWTWAIRQNHSHRPSAVLGEEADNTRVCDIRVSRCSDMIQSCTGMLSVHVMIHVVAGDVAGVVLLLMSQPACIALTWSLPSMHSISSEFEESFTDLQIKQASQALAT